MLNFLKSLKFREANHRTFKEILEMKGTAMDSMFLELRNSEKKVPFIQGSFEYNSKKIELILLPDLDGSLKLSLKNDSLILFKLENNVLKWDDRVRSMFSNSTLELAFKKSVLEGVKASFVFYSEKTRQRKLLKNKRIKRHNDKMANKYVKFGQSLQN